MTDNTFIENMNAWLKYGPGPNRLTGDYPYDEQKTQEFYIQSSTDFCREVVFPLQNEKSLTEFTEIAQDHFRTKWKDLVQTEKAWYNARRQPESFTDFALNAFATGRT